MKVICIENDVKVGEFEFDDEYKFAVIEELGATEKLCKQRTLSPNSKSVVGKKE